MGLRSRSDRLVAATIMVFLVLAVPGYARIFGQIRTRHISGGSAAPVPASHQDPEPVRHTSRTATCRYCHCKKVYLDAGTNIGVHIRKLYEPEKFPRASVLPLFSKLFGEGDRHDVCAFGFEPNPRHTAELHSIEETYSMLGYPVKIFTRTAVSDEEGLATFFLDDNRRRNDWGATLLDNVYHNKTKTVVRLMDFTSFILEELSPEAIILMKMDIEGAEYTILPSLMLSGALCKVNTVYMEWHRKFYPKGWVYGQKGASLRPEQIPGVVQYLTSHAKGCSTEFINLDDESYGRANIRQLPLPEIKVPIVAVDGVTTD